MVENKNRRVSNSGLEHKAINLAWGFAIPTVAYFVGLKATGSDLWAHMTMTGVSLATYFLEVLPKPLEAPHKSLEVFPKSLRDVGYIAGMLGGTVGIGYEIFSK